MIFALFVGSWVQLQSPRFVMRTDLREAEARVLLTQVERDVVDLSDAPQLALMQVPPRQRVMLVVFAKKHDFDQTLSWKEELGVRFTPRPGLSGEDWQRIYTTADTLPQQLPLVARLQMHAVLDDLMEDPPLWLSLGLESYASTARHTAEDQWLMGSPPNYPAMTGEVPSLEALMQVADDYSLSGEVEKYRIEQCAWRLTHLLMQGSSQDPISAEWMQRLATWFASIRNGENPGPALIKAFAPVDIGALYAAHFTAPKLNVSRSPAAARAVDPKTIKLPDAAKLLPMNAGEMPGNEGHLAAAFATDSVGTRRTELAQVTPSDAFVLAMQMKNELSETQTDELRCQAALPFATKLLSSVVPRHKQIARRTVVGCNKKPPAPPYYQSAAAKLTPPVLVAGDKNPKLGAELATAVKGQKATIIAKMRVDRDGKVIGVYVLRSNLPRVTEAVVQNLRAWKFKPTGMRYEFIEPFTFSF